MSITVVHQEPCWLIRLDGQVTLTSAPELKTLLVEWLACGKSLELDLEGVEETDITILQLLSAAVRDAGSKGTEITGRASEFFLSAARDLGFAQLPGFPFTE